MVQRHEFHALILLSSAIFLLSWRGPLLAQQNSAPPGLATAGLPTVPLPERNPRRLAPVHPAQIEAEEWSAQEIQDANDHCAAILTNSGAVFRPIAPIREGQCGTPAPIELFAIGSNPSVAIEPPARVTCSMAATLSAWSVNQLRHSALNHLGHSITAIRNVASYVCRNRYNSSDKPISEHALANALDVAAFRTSEGKWITVLDNWALPANENPQTEDSQPVEVSASPQAQKTDDALPSAGLPVNKPEQLDAPDISQSNPEPNPETLFIREVHAGACALFGTVLGPDANEAHMDHFHFDLAERRHSNYCE